MKNSAIIVLMNSSAPPPGMSDARVISIEELRQWIVSGSIVKHLFRYDEAKLLAYDMNVIGRPFLTFFVLKCLSRHRCWIEDERRRQKEVTLLELLRLFVRTVRDFRRKYEVLQKIHKDLQIIERGAERSPMNRPALNDSATPVYLRSDLWFGVKSGGSVGHIAGVLNNLDNFVGKPVFLTTDRIPTVRPDIEAYIISPSQEFWDYEEIPSLAFNATLEGAAQEILAGKKISFLYQRYSLSNFAGLKLAMIHRVPFALEYNGSEIWINRHWGKPLKYEKLSGRIELLNLRSADLVVVVSSGMKEELTARGIKASKILVNPNGVDPKRYSPEIDGSALRGKYNLDGKTVIGFIGTFGRWHGAEVLADAFGCLIKRFPEYRKNVRLLMIGDGLTMPQVRENLSRHNVMDICILTGLVPQDEGPQHMAVCDILVASHVPNPDGSPFFGSPTKLFEYMAMGKGIVASDLDQIGEILKHKETAWMVKPGDAESLMHGMKALIDDLDLRERLGKAARQEVVANYSWHEHTRKIIEKLRTVMGK